jgi:hypothetical protein
VNGARWVQEEVLETNPEADLRVYAIWFSMYPTDLRERWPADVLTDPRVVHYWDDARTVGRWYAERTDGMGDALAPGSTGLGGTILWDAYLVYGPESHWNDAPTDLRRWGRTILAARESLREAVADLVLPLPTSERAVTTPTAEVK